MLRNLWRERASATTDYCLRNFWDERAKKFHPATPADPKALPWEFMWGNGVAFSMLVGSGDKARIAACFEGLQGYWDTRALIPGYDAYLSSPGNSDKYYDDNAWMVLTFVEAYEKTGERKYLLRAVEALRFVLSGWDEKLGGGIYWREWPAPLRDRDPAALDEALRAHADQIAFHCYQQWSKNSG